MSIYIRICNSLTLKEEYANINFMDRAGLRYIRTSILA